MSKNSLHILYGFCKDQYSPNLFERLIKDTPVLKVKTIGHVADKTVFAALTYSVVPPKINDINWIQLCIPNKKKSVCEKVECPALSRKKYHQFRLSNEEVKRLQKSSRLYRKQQNLALTEKNWRQHINHKTALSEAKRILIPTSKDSFFLTHDQQPTLYSIWTEPKKKEKKCQAKTG